MSISVSQEFQAPVEMAAQVCVSILWTPAMLAEAAMLETRGAFQPVISWSVGTKNSFGNVVITHPLHCSCWELHSRAVSIQPSWILPQLQTF